MVVQAADLGVSLTLNFMQQLGQAVGMLARQYDVTVVIQDLGPQQLPREGTVASNTKHLSSIVRSGCI
jgi:hypothetical protein